MEFGLPEREIMLICRKFRHVAAEGRDALHPTARRAREKFPTAISPSIQKHFGLFALIRIAPTGSQRSCLTKHLTHGTMSRFV